MQEVAAQFLQAFECRLRQWIGGFKRLLSHDLEKRTVTNAYQRYRSHKDTAKRSSPGPSKTIHEVTRNGHKHNFISCEFVDRSGSRKRQQETNLGLYPVSVRLTPG